MKKSELIKKWYELWINKKDIEAIIIHNNSLTKNQYFLVDRVDNFQLILDDFKCIKSGFPLEYITSKCEFYGREFYVDKHVLIPRIDTELLIDILKQKRYSLDTQYLDVWTGSGIIPITLALELRGFKTICACDICEKALKVCNKNIKIFEQQGNIHTYKSDLLTDFSMHIFDVKKKLIVIANLPYIKDYDFKNMWTSTIRYEPKLALYGGKETWFELYQDLIIQCCKLSGIWFNIDLFIEIGFDQSEKAAMFLREKQLDFEFHKDSATIKRVVEIHF